MSARKDGTPELALLALGIGILLLSTPTCRTGCRSFAEHLVRHGIEALLGGAHA